MVCNIEFNDKCVEICSFRGNLRRAMEYMNFGQECFVVLVKWNEEIDYFSLVTAWPPGPEDSEI